ncbi:MAG: hypothetical protein ACT4PT_13415 [Methanobacteriota archaeon]
MRPTILLASVLAVGSVLAGCVTSDGPGPAPPDPSEVAALRIDAVTEVTSTGVAFEPSVKVGPDGTIYVTGPGFAENRRHTRLWVSDDEGATFTEIQFADPATGVSNFPTGFEGDLAIDAAGAAYFVDLSLASSQLSRSTDGGKTWSLRNAAVFPVGGGDRPWAAASPADMVAVTWNQIPSGFWIAVSRDGGLTFPTQTYFEGTQYAGAGPVPRGWVFAGVPAIDATGAVYVGRASANGPVLHKSTDGGASFAAHPVHETEARTAYLMTVPAVDAAGNVYVAWAEDLEGNVEVFYAASTDRGETFGEPVRASHHGGSSVMPWIAAGAAGHVAIAYYGAPDARGVPSETDADWYPFLVDVHDAASETPSFRIARMQDAPVLSAPVCTEGLSCDTGGSQASRALADYLQVAIDPMGRPQAVWMDEDGNVYWGRGVAAG